jgi:hypothetical protein
MSVLLAVNCYPAAGDTARRNEAALDSLRVLQNVALVNVQPVRQPHEVPGVRTIVTLRKDAAKVSGRVGPPKPIITEIIDAAAETAVTEGRAYVAFANSDVLVQQSAIDVILQQARETYVFSRMDFDPATGRDLGVLLAGSDVFVFTPAWWWANRRRFRDYILGEFVWDNVFTSITLCHSNGVLLNRAPHIRHERHQTSANAGRGAFASYTRLLSALDRPYFSIWAKYYAELVRLRASGASEADELTLQRAVFKFAPGVRGRAVQLARALKAMARYRADRRTLS